MPSNLVCNSCKKTFIYPAKETKTLPMIKIAYPFGCSTDEKTETHEPIIIEKSVCPHCYEPDIAAQEIPVEEKGEITALLSVPNSEVNNKLTEGYKVLEDKIYAKETIMVKRVNGLEKLGDAEQ